jgi:hypothetical protein
MRIYILTYTLSLGYSTPMDILMDASLVKALNQEVLNQARGLEYIVKDVAPSTEAGLFNQPSLVVWAGASENTIYKDAQVNWAFRAVHDALHLKTRLGFTPQEEIEMGRIQASKIGSDLIAKLFYIEIAGQAEFYLKTGQFVQDQVKFTMDQLKAG